MWTVVALDFGIKRNILRRLASYGCRVIVVPAHTSPEEILKYNPDGIFLSNGPGDPSAVTEGIATAKALLKDTRFWDFPWVQKLLNLSSATGD
jgi:carbamoyl-phosphate synthase small subunit